MTADARSDEPRSSTSARRRREGLGAIIGLLGCAVLVVLGTRTGLARLTPDGDATATAGTDGGVLLVQSDRTGMELPQLTPGQAVTRCTTVTYSGDSPGSLSASADVEVATHGLDRLIAVRLEQGTPGSNPDCIPLADHRVLFSGPMSSFPTAGQRTGAVDQTGSGRQVTRFRITYTLAAGAPNSAQGATASLRIRWSVQGS